MILGSNNSISYLEPSNWWFKIFSFLTKCQTKACKYQYLYCGVRFFDFRLYVNEHNHLIGKDGTCKYTIFSLYEILDFLNRQGDAFVEVTLYEKYTDHLRNDSSTIEKKFIESCRIFEEIYPDVKFCGGRRKFDGFSLYNFKHKVPAIINIHNDSVWYSFAMKFLPFMRKKLNQKYIEKYRDVNGYLVLDHVDKK